MSILPGKFVAVRVFSEVIHQTLMAHQDNGIMYKFEEHAMLFPGTHELVLVLSNQMCLFSNDTTKKFVIKSIQIYLCNLKIYLIEEEQSLS